MIKRTYRYWKTISNLILILQNWIMTDPILYLSMLLGLGGVYVLVSSFNDDDGDDDDGERYIISNTLIQLNSWNFFLKSKKLLVKVDLVSKNLS